MFPKKLEEGKCRSNDRAVRFYHREDFVRMSSDSFDSGIRHCPTSNSGDFEVTDERTEEHSLQMKNEDEENQGDDHQRRKKPRSWWKKSRSIDLVEQIECAGEEKEGTLTLDQPCFSRSQIC